MDYFFTSKEVSQLLKTSMYYVRKMIREQKLVAYKIGRRFIIKEQDLNNYLNSNCRVKDER